MEETKFCKHCGEKISADAVICTKCGRMVEKIEQSGGAAAPIIINNSASSSASAAAAATATAASVPTKRAVNKWTAFVLCLLLGYVGAHKFYEGKTGMGILYIFTLGFCGIGWLIDLFAILCRPNPYYI